MAIDINTNIDSLVASRNLNLSQATLSQSLRRLSSGLRINSAADDPSGLAIAARMTAQINGLSQANVNANEGISLLQTADSAMSSITDNLQRIRNLSVEAANGSYSSADRQSLDGEVQQLKDEIQQIASTTAFNGIALLNGSVNQMAIQVGASLNDTITIGTIPSMQLAQLGTSGAGSLVAGTNTVGALGAGDLILNGIAVGASITGAGAGEEASSALEIAAAINAVTFNSGVTATAATTVTGVAPPGSAAIQDFVINGVAVSSVGAGVTNLEAAINQAAASSGTGITATTNVSGGVTLTAANGENIDIELGGTALNASAAAANRAAFLNATGLPDSAVGTQAYAAVAAIPAVPAQYDIHGHLLVAGQPGQPYQPPAAASYASSTGIVTLRSNDTAGILIAGNNAASAGLTNGLENQNSTSTIPGIATLNVLTQSAAQRAILSVDSAISTVTNSQAQLGAYENRLASAASNNQSGLENLSASRSTVEDASFAAEVASLSTSKILQSAGNAMLVQANSSPRLVKTLLR